MKKQRSYLGELAAGIKATLKGMRLTGRHYRKGYDRAAPLGIEHPDYFKKTTGPITVQYPKEQVPVPDTGRYRLHMETEDCIGCDKCARICPVDCITIETFRADGDLGRTSDGTVKRLHLPVFDIDMGKCMFCGLCTTVCPTECLTMTKVYDFSEYDRDLLNYNFGAYSPEEEARIRRETEEALERKKAAKAAEQAAAAAAAPAVSPGDGSTAPPPAARPKPLSRPRPVTGPSAPPAGDEGSPPPPASPPSNDAPA